MMATSRESFTAPPQIATGTGAKWNDLTTVNNGPRTPARVQSIQWLSDGLTVEGWLLLPEHADGKVQLVTTVHGGPASATVLDPANTE